VAFSRLSGLPFCLESDKNRAEALFARRTCGIGVKGKKTNKQNKLGEGSWETPLARVSKEQR
jgi:hypothetical protein|tara:strand:+ start:5912 stop:6097 length:186 start_codon:yes stop_codon:yes gene_type:complete